MARCPTTPALVALVLAITGGIHAAEEARPAQVQYKAEFFSVDGPLRTAASSHSFARFTKLEGGKVVDVVDISWMPEPGFFRRGNRMPLLREVPGHNYTLEQTRALAGNKPVLSHGSYYITPSVFEAAQRRKADLESGRYNYKMLDRFSGSGINCIHALAGVLGYLNTGLARGVGATSGIVGYFLSTGMMSRQPLGLPEEATPHREVPARSSVPSAAVESPKAVSPTHAASNNVHSSPAPLIYRRPLLGRRLWR